MQLSSAKLIICWYLKCYSDTCILEETWKKLFAFFSAGMSTAEEKTDRNFYLCKIHLTVLKSSTRYLFYEPLDILNLILSTVLFFQNSSVAKHVTVSIFLFLWRNTVTSCSNVTATMDSPTGGLRWLLFITQLWFSLYISPVS